MPQGLREIIKLVFLHGVAAEKLDLYTGDGVPKGLSLEEARLAILALVPKKKDCMTNTEANMNWNDAIDTILKNFEVGK